MEDGSSGEELPKHLVHDIGSSIAAFFPVILTEEMHSQISPPPEA
jgi:hypothetical protein